ncbi:hypothetical protein [Loktanella sp. Alg231-35]|uniref:hypothetical protein n=1 Tax=Loktanella sp. Alg231-35 TaxID=1922220 RepID=UPI000D560A7A|nr:hypothetical protein [Loktanella sp. Alg231-35]
MTKLSISFAAAMLSVSLVPAANAYGTEPVPQSYASLTRVAMLPTVASDHEGTCAVSMAPLLASILGLSDDASDDKAARPQASLACVEE